MKPDGIYQFGKLRIDALARTLPREEEMVTLNRRAFDVLLYFVQNPGRILIRDELLKAEECLGGYFRGREQSGAEYFRVTTGA